MDKEMPDLRESIDSHYRTTVKSLKDEYTVQQARELVPISKLVQDNLEVLDGDYQRNLLPLLVDWFKEEFFSWFRTPECNNCNKTLRFENVYTNVENLWVEKYICSDEECEYCYEFIRHIDPAILLVTRKGRCGEWANCFLVFLKALEYDARLVVDVSDHVWNEVWSEVEQRWIHVDPCENAVDTPLLYEVGWSKKLSYCIAFGEHYILDVTPRYTTSYTTLKSRRTLVGEKWLEKYLDGVSSTLLQELPPAARETVILRREKEKAQLKQLISKPEASHSKSHFQGRKTGSMAWRIERGEFHTAINNLVVIEADSISNDAKNESALFSLRYNSYINLYQSNLEEYERYGWSSLTYSSANLDHKFERDWKTAYVARYEECPAELVGKIIWRFKLSKLDNWSRIELQVNGTLYPNTMIMLTLKSYDANVASMLDEISLQLNSVNIIHRNQINQEVSVIDLTVELTGGDKKDAVAWQKPQLFRQALSEKAEWPFDFKVY